MGEGEECLQLLRWVFPLSMEAASNCSLINSPDHNPLTCFTGLGHWGSRRCWLPSSLSNSATQWCHSHTEKTQSEISIGEEASFKRKADTMGHTLMKTQDCIFTIALIFFPPFCIRTLKSLPHWPVQSAGLATVRETKLWHWKAGKVKPQGKLLKPQGWKNRKDFSFTQK